MHQSSEHKAQPKNGRALAIAAALLCAAALSQPNLAYAGPHGGGGGGGFHGGGFGGFHTGGMGGFHGGFARMHGGGFGRFTGAASTGIDFTMAGSATIDFAITGFSSVERSHIPMGGITIQTMAIMTTVSPTPHRLGIIAPILPAITLM